LQRKIVTTEDGSKTIHLVEWNEHYHSIHGAIQEANHVFIKHGLLFFAESFPNRSDVSILEIGFGTGLNAFITLIESEKLNLKFHYVGVEAFPISPEEFQKLNYSEMLDIGKSHLFEKMHQIPWELEHPIDSNFTLTKQKIAFADIDAIAQFDLIYFDAFGPRVQPELWTETIFKKMFDALKPEGTLVTYSAKGSARRAMLAVGFNVEKLPGPPGKREMLRASKGF
jgi:tRNA U34 5-methylaminomethyl-2-thiouridine-forming methyltransferase MnmC